MRIKFITLNVFKGGLFADNIVDFINKEDADIVAMQEVNDVDSELIKRIMQEGKHRYSAFGSMLKYKNDGEHGPFTLSKFPIDSSKTIFFDVPYGEYDLENMSDFSKIPRNILHTVIKLNNISMNVFNIHGIWGFDGDDNERRLKMSETIVEQIKDKQNVILAGDFNLRPDTQTIRNIEKHLKNVFKDELKTTFNMKHKTDGGYATAVVDMIFISNNIEVMEHYCPEVDVSDHLPLIAILDI